MRNKKFFVILIVLLAFGCGFYGFSYLKEALKDIETMSAKVDMELEDVEADHDGTISSIKIQSFSNVKIGDVIAEISKNPSKTNCTTEAESKKVTDDYKDSVLMYKDGIITKDEYDASLKKYKSEKSNLCSSKTELVPVYAEQDGIFILDDEYKTGSAVNEESILGVIRPEKVIIKAYFSPKDAKRIKAGKNAQVSIIKYPEKQFTGVVKSIGNIDINGREVLIEIIDDTSDLNIAGDDAATVKILK